MTTEKRHRRIDDETWMQRHWRPMMAWQYFAICLFDFMIAPLFFAVYTHYTKQAAIMWIPLTLQGGGLYHLSMGAIVGVSSWSRSQEKINMPVAPLAPPAPAPIPTKPVVLPTTAKGADPEL